MFILKSQETIKKAIERARTIKPHVRAIRFGRYEVSGSTGGFYTVLCYRNRGQKVMTAHAKQAKRVARAFIVPLPPGFIRTWRRRRWQRRTKRKERGECLNTRLSPTFNLPKIERHQLCKNNSITPQGREAPQSLPHSQRRASVLVIESVSSTDFIAPIIGTPSQRRFRARILASRLLPMIALSVLHL